jgi:trehalose-phosphatase
MSINALRVEPKPFGVALHFRSAPVAHHERIASMITDAFRRLPSVTIRRGHAIVEAAVVPTTKGDAITGLRASLGATSVLYCGDDSTDEDAFAALRRQDLGIKVGPGPTLAAARVASPDALALVLGDLAIRRQRHRPRNSSKEDRT